MSLVHLHLVLNHVPMIGLVFVILLLGVALARNSSELGKAGLVTLVCLGVATVAVFLTGEPAEEAVEHLAGVSEQLIHDHEEAADVALGAMVVAGVLATGLLIWHRRRALSRVVTAASLGLALVAGGVMSRVAYLGGQIRHTEIRSTAAMPADREEHEREP